MAPPPPRSTISHQVDTPIQSFQGDSRTKIHWHNGDLRGHSRNLQVSARSFLVVIVAFSLLLLLTLLCLYIRRACRYRRMVITVSSSTEHASPLDSTEGLDREAIDGIPVVLYVGGDDAQCSICLASFEDGKKVRVLPPCGHHFHPCCVDEWLRTHPSCPLCRTVLEPCAGGGSTEGEVVV